MMSTPAPKSLKAIMPTKVAITAMAAFSPCSSITAMTMKAVNDAKMLASARHWSCMTGSSL